MADVDFAVVLTETFSSVGLTAGLTETQIEQLQNHYELLWSWNRKMNLTSIRDPKMAIRRHYGECVHFAHLFERLADRPCMVQDAGSGPGFPGIPMAIVLPESSFVLVEADQRKAVFLREASRSLSNVSVVCERLEQVQLQADWIVSRAVRIGDILTAVPRIAPKVGLLIGQDAVAEALSTANLSWQDPMELPWADRTVALFGEFSAD